MTKAWPEAAQSQSHHAAQNVTGLEINQAFVSQLRFRNVIQGHKGEISNLEHSFFIFFLLQLFFKVESYYLEDQLVQNL